MRHSIDAKQGLKLFIGKAGCINCHNTPLFSDDDFHNIGLHIDTNLSPQADPTERGRASNQPLICDPMVAGGDFNVNGHFSDDPDTTRDGSFCGQKISDGLHLSYQEKTWLQEFLNTLTGDRVPAQYLQDLHNP